MEEVLETLTLARECEQQYTITEKHSAWKTILQMDNTNQNQHYT